MAQNYNTFLELATRLVDDKGNLHRVNFPFPLLEHQQKFLTKWNEDNAFFHSFKKFRLPLCHRGAEKIIRETLPLSPALPLTDAHVRRAVVVACLTPLRQNIGSCFATAPAIVIHEEQQECFIADLYELLTTGRLKRVISGTESSVPLCLSVNSREMALLKSWEYTLASLSETKMEFSRWNLYMSLGLHPEEKGGIGELLYQKLEKKLQEVNEKASKYYLEYSLALDQARASEGLLKNAISETEARRLRAEYQARYHHMRSCLELYESLQKQGEIFSRFFSFLIQQYERRFPEYFQEIYDPEMESVLQEEMYDDRPAGFRLVYKHGRQDASLWTSIQNGTEFTRALVDFFNMTEQSVQDACVTAEEKKTIAELTTSVIQHIRSSDFIPTTEKRMAKHGRSPWAYISGGTMDTLVKTYYRLETSPTCESRSAHSPLDLLTFLLDTLKSMPRVSKRLLVSSPTHAFTLLPHIPLFKEGWEDRGFTYTWIRDTLLLPGKKFYESPLSQEEQAALLERLSLSLPTQPFMPIADFYAQLVAHGVKDAEAFLYRSLPLIPQAACQAALQHLLGHEVELLKGLPDYLISEELQALAKAHLAEGDIVTRAQALGLAPRPLLFADTNWEGFYFAFVVSPITCELELWRVDRTGSLGFPMGNAWFEISQQHPWVVYTKPQEYGM